MHGSETYSSHSIPGLSNWSQRHVNNDWIHSYHGRGDEIDYVTAFVSIGYLTGHKTAARIAIFKCTGANFSQECGPHPWFSSFSDYHWGRYLSKLLSWVIFMGFNRNWVTKWLHLFVPHESPRFLPWDWRWISTAHELRWERNTIPVFSKCEANLAPVCERYSLKDSQVNCSWRLNFRRFLNLDWSCFVYCYFPHFINFHYYLGCGRTKVNCLSGPYFAIRIFIQVLF